MKNGINVVSCFDGLAGGLIALKRRGIKVNKYYAFEIDKYPIQIAKKNHPEIIELGDINNWREFKDIEVPDLIIAGSPCQGFSIAGLGLNFDDPRSKLFFVFVDILNYWKSKNPNLKFMLENVKMKQEWKRIITEYMGVEPIEINSALVSAQNRKRLYWTNIEGVSQPEDRGLILRDILEDNVEQKYMGGYNPTYKTQSNSLHNLNGKSNVICAGVHGYALGYIKENKKQKVPEKFYLKEDQLEKVKFQKGAKSIKRKVGTFEYVYKEGAIQFPNSLEGKAQTLVASGQSTSRSTTYIKDEDDYRKLTPLECERLQTLDDNYTEGVSNTQRYRMIGNGWTIEVISHIFSFLPKEFYPV